MPSAGVAEEPKKETAAPSDPAAPSTPFGLRQLGYDTRYLLTRPAHLDGRGAAKVAGAAGTAAALYFVRDDIREFFQDHRSGGRERLLKGTHTMGKGAFAPALALTSYLASFATHNDREKETSLLLLESMGFSVMFAGAGQFVLSSQRPEEGDRVRLLRTGGHGVSADAALAASVVAPLRRQYLVVRDGDGAWRRGLKRGAAGLLYAGAVLTAFQRIDQDKHWAPDAFLGTVVGLTVGEILCDAHARARRARDQAAERSTARSSRQAVLRQRSHEPAPPARAP